MEDVIGYEEKRPETMEHITSGYPRFVTHFYVRQVQEEWCKRLDLVDREIFLTTSATAVVDLFAFAGEDEDLGKVELDGVWGVHAPIGSPAARNATVFFQHTGCGVSSRWAEDYLLKNGLISTAQEEKLWEEGDAAGKVRGKLSVCFEVERDDVLLTTSGMNAFYAVFRAIAELQAEKGRHLWVQLGWLYVDTIEILRKMTGGEARHLVISDVLNMEAIEALLEEKGDQIAGFITEAPTNPLIQTTDIPHLRALTERYDIPLVLDPTLASPLNVTILPYADVAVNSLTKYAASTGDVMMGAVVFNPKSRWTQQLRARVERRVIAPYEGDMRRMAVEIDNYASVIEKINGNTVDLVRFLENHPRVEAVYWAYREGAGANYRKIQRRENAPGGVISIKLRQPLAEFFDRVEVAKGPSFGVVFTLMCPFLYLAHYDLVSTDEGRETLRRHNIDTELLRISVGTEDIERIIASFEDAF